MSKTFEALKRSQTESGKTSWDAPEMPAPGETKPPLQAVQGNWQPKDLVPETKERDLNLIREVIQEPTLPELPSRPSKAVKFKDPSMAVEEYRKMKYKILANGPGKPIKTILFCSSYRGEGTSTVFLNFGQTLAGEGYRVLLVDANLRHPTLHRLFHLPQENGLTDLCFGNDNLETVLKNTLWNNLWVVTSGHSYNNPTAAFESEFLETSIEGMKMQGDWVLFDAPPMNSCSDALALAGKVDGVVLVVEYERTRREVLQQYKDRLEKNGAHILGVVLNKRRFHIPRWVYNRL
ncbi:MAG: CpsD/CapB family tyrosine-protein kinase [Syntrophaceae bacterium]|nr:CpsD/CapB family tyrosine-protein kinase [Syntrophaceae bacterium]